MVVVRLIKKQLWQDRSNKTRLILVIVLLCLTVRSLPYLAPIRPRDIAQDRRAIEFSDRNGLPLGTILSRDRNHTAVVPLDRVSPHFKNAILAAEDRRFYHHGALEMEAIVRAIFLAIQHKKIVSGASTITMQLARMLEPAPRTLPNKIEEIWRSWRLVAGMSKDEILHAYINRLPMGGNIYGVEAASRVYFGTPAAELNIARSSLLAALPNNPTYFNPYYNWERLKQRQKYVLDRMVEDGYITRTQADLAYAEEITLQPRQQGIIAAPHFLFWLADRLPQDRPPQIRTTIDRSLQQFVETQVKDIVRTLAPQNVSQAAVVVIDNRTGEILAYVGSVDYFARGELGRNDGVQSLRQPGSTLKPFLYQLALEKRIIRPNTVLADVPTYYAIPGAKLYSPTDYSETFAGPVRVRIALANSLNIPAVRVLERVGVDKFLDRLHELGFANLDRAPEYYGLGLSLGSGEVSLWELARAYRILAREGKITPTITTIPQFSESGTQNLSKNSPTWGLITDMLRDRHARALAFGVDSVLNLPFPVAVKTGTSSNYRDTWTVGYTTDYTVATWVGNFDGKPMKQVSGVVGAAPLWQRIMLHLHQDWEPSAFSPPSRMVQRPICALSGLKPTSACPSVVQEYFYREDLKDYENNPDTFYEIVEGKSTQYRLNLPPEYDEWLAMQQRSTFIPSQLQILFPRDGDRFLIDSEGDTTSQLEFKIAGALESPLELWLNGKKLATNSSNSFFWDLRPGQWTLEVKNGRDSDRLTFFVELAPNRATRWGFSSATP